MSFQIHEKSQNSTQTETWRKNPNSSDKIFVKVWPDDVFERYGRNSRTAQTAEAADVAAKIYQKIGSTEKRNIPGRSRKTLDGAATKIK